MRAKLLVGTTALAMLLSPEAIETFALLTNPNLRPGLSSPRSIERSALATSFARRARDLGHVVGLGGDKLKNFDRSHWFDQDENARCCRLHGSALWRQRARRP